MRNNFSVKLSVSILFVITFFCTAYGADNKKSWEVIGGGGISLDENHFRHAFIAPAMSIKPPNQKILVYRFEGDLELIETKRHATALIGLAPFLRFYLSGGKQGPFLEIGAGANAITSNHTGRKDSGGAFVFSLMGGAGYEFSIYEKPFSVSCRLRHLSNGHIYRINESINALLFLVSIGL